MSNGESKTAESTARLILGLCLRCKQIALSLFKTQKFRIAHILAQNRDKGALMNQPNSIKLALFGLGYMGQNHLRVLNMLKDVEIVFVFDTNESLARQIAASHNVRYLADYRAELPNLDGAVIATPTTTHLDYIASLSDSVRHLFVEKPLTEDLPSTQRALALMKEHGANIQVGFIERYNPAVAVLRQAIENSSKVINIDFVRTNKVSKRIKDVDVVIDLMIHDIDLALTLNGMPKKISAYGYMSEGSIDYARAILTHTNGVFSNIVASRVTEKRRRQISVTCDDMFVDCNLLSKEVFVHKQTITDQYLSNVSIVSKTETINVRPHEALLLQLIDFVAFCRGEKKSVPNEVCAHNAICVATEIQRQIGEEYC